MFIDADIEFNPEDILRMVAYNKPIVVGAYPKKAVNWQSIIDAARNDKYEETAGTIEGHSSNYVVNFEFNTDENGNKICAVLRSPYIVNLVPFDDGNSEQQQYKVSFTKWIPYSSSKEFRIPFSQIVTIGEVEQDILNLYEQNFGDTDDDTTDGGDAGDNGTSDSSDNAEEPGVSDSTD